MIEVLNYCYNGSCITIYQYNKLTCTPFPWPASLIAQLVKNLPAMQETPIRFLGREEGKAYPLQYSWASLVAHLVKNPPEMQETPVQLLSWEDPLEKEMATHFSILA